MFFFILHKEKNNFLTVNMWSKLKKDNQDQGCCQPSTRKHCCWTLNNSSLSSRLIFFFKNNYWINVGALSHVQKPLIALRKVLKFFFSSKMLFFRLLWSTFHVELKNLLENEQNQTSSFNFILLADDEIKMSIFILNTLQAKPSFPFFLNENESILNN